MYLWFIPHHPRVFYHISRFFAISISYLGELLDKYMKTTKVRGAGLIKYIGRSHLVDDGENWYEWSMGLSCSKEGRLGLV